jgi:hypothetical protein
MSKYHLKMHIPFPICLFILHRFISGLFYENENENKIQDSCFGFICWAIASVQGNSNLNVLGPLPNEGSNVSFSNELLVLVSLHPNDLTLKSILFFHRC